MSGLSVLVAGFAEDVTLVKDQLPRGVVCHCIDQTVGSEASVPPSQMVVYVFSSDTAWSSQLQGVFNWINYWTQASERYVVGIGDVDLQRAIFHFAEKLPKISLEELRKKLELQLDR
ncbi:MAG: hypothetical protein ACM34E_19215 [Acidobacteriota bacterium]